MRRLSTNARVLAGIAIAAALVVGVTEWRVAANLQARLEAVAYYRVKSSYIVKDTGEAIGFDYVAACATVVTMYRDGDRSVDTPFGVAPKMMFAPTRDGHAIQLVTPRACDHQVEDGFIPPDLIPLTIFHDSVDNLAFGWGYTSQDAYDNARSRLDFEGASVTAATYADFLAWRAKAAASFTSVGQIRSPWGYSDERGSGLNVSRWCRMYIRYPVLPAGKPGLTAEWEKRGRPEFWMADDRGSDPQAWEDMPRSVEAENFYNYYVRPRTKDGGLGTIGLYSNQVWGKVHYHQDRVYPSNEVYPYLPISLASMPPPILASRVFPTKVPVSDDWKGLAACGVNDPNIDDLFEYGMFNEVRDYVKDDGWVQKGHAGELIGDRTSPFMANDTVISLVPHARIDQPRRFFQRDEFVLTQGPSNLEGIMP